MTNQTRITLRNIRKELQEANIKICELTTQLNKCNAKLTEAHKFTYWVIQEQAKTK